MLTEPDAKTLLLSILNYRRGDTPEIVILEERTVPKDYGWIFFFDYKGNRGDGNDRYMMVGTNAYLVEKIGCVFPLPGSFSLDERVQQVEDWRRENPDEKGFEIRFSSP